MLREHTLFEQKKNKTTEIDLLKIKKEWSGLYEKISVKNLQQLKMYQVKIKRE